MADHPLLARALDILPVGMGFFSCTGALIHANRTLVRLLEAEPDSLWLRREILDFTRFMCSLLRERGRDEGEEPLELARREFRRLDGRYCLQGYDVGRGSADQDAQLLVVLDRYATEPLLDDLLRQRLGLTKQEMRVAALLAEGKANEEIAQSLFISPHTARTHTRRILHKLGIRSRAEVGARLLRG